MSRLVNYSDPLDPMDYLPDPKRDPVAEPLYPLIATLIQGAIEKDALTDDIRLDPLVEDIMSNYADKEAVQAYFNTGIKDRLGMINVVLRVFKLTGLNLGITEWFNSDFPVIPYKFFVDMYEYPHIPIADVITLIYKIKNERSHLLSFRDVDRSKCPGYFILDQSLLDSLEFLTDARGEVYRGVKICWIDEFTMGSSIILNNPPAPAFLYGYNQPLAMGEITIFPADGLNVGSMVFLSISDAYRLRQNVFLPSLMKDRGMMAYSYGEYELGYEPEEDDPYAVELDGFTFSMSPPVWGNTSLLDPYVADDAVILLGSEPRGTAMSFIHNRIYVRDPINENLLFLQSIDEAIIDGILSFTRATPAWYYNEQGLFVQAASGQWRLQHDPVTLEPLGYVAEPQRTNIIPNSAVLVGAQNSTISANEIQAPNGLFEVDRLIEDMSTGEHLADDALAATTGQTYIWSFYVKAPPNHSRLCFIRTIGAAGAYRLFDPVAGAWVGAGVGPDLVDSGFVPGPDGFWRVWLKVLCSSTGTLYACLQLHDGVSNNYTGDGLGSLYFWGKDLQLGSYLTTHIPTNGSPVTRNADVMSGDLSKMTFDPTAGTAILAAVSVKTSETSTPKIAYQLDDGTANERITLSRDLTAEEVKEVVDGGVSQVDDNSGTFPPNVAFKHGFAWAPNDFQWTRDGLTTSTDGSGTLPTVTTLRIGVDQTGANLWGGTIQEFTLIPRRMNTADLAARTTL